MTPDPDPSLFKRRRFTVNVPHVLVAKMLERKNKERYSSDSNYLLGLIAFDVLCQREHRLTGPLMREPRHIQDKVFEQLAKDFPDKGFEEWIRRKNAAGWFESRVAELVAQAKQEEAVANEKPSKKKKRKS